VRGEGLIGRVAQALSRKLSNARSGKPLPAVGPYSIQVEEAAGRTLALLRPPNLKFFIEKKSGCRGFHLTLFSLSQCFSPTDEALHLVFREEVCDRLKRICCGKFCIFRERHRSNSLSDVIDDNEPRFGYLAGFLREFREHVSFNWTAV
jgi:hypothetical protein